MNLTGTEYACQDHHCKRLPRVITCSCSLTVIQAGLELPVGVVDHCRWHLIGYLPPRLPIMSPAVLLMHHIPHRPLKHLLSFLCKTVWTVQRRCVFFAYERHKNYWNQCCSSDWSSRRGYGFYSHTPLLPLLWWSPPWGRHRFHNNGPFSFHIITVVGFCWIAPGRAFN